MVLHGNFVQTLFIRGVEMLVCTSVDYHAINANNVTLRPVWPPPPLSAPVLDIGTEFLSSVSLTIVMT